MEPATSSDDLAGMLRQLQHAQRTNDVGIYLGHDDRGWRFASRQQAVLVLGPPRSGKTSSFIIPNILATAGPVVSTSTKADVLRSTGGIRSMVGDVHLFDPLDHHPPSSRHRKVRWSPLQQSGDWPGALATARNVVDVATSVGGRGRPGEGSHWNERATALLAPFFLAAACEGEPMRKVLEWVDRRTALPAQQILDGSLGSGTDLARHLLDGITQTDEREQSGIWSTASGCLSGFRVESVLASMDHPDFDAHAFVGSSDALYIAIPGHQQTLMAPLVVGLLDDIKRATYDREPGAPPTLLALDEVANIAPLPDLPNMVSEGGGQGLTTLICLQDLSQARSRWTSRADGFPSLFGTTVVLPGIGDVRTLEALSTIAGEEEVAVRTTSRSLGASQRPLQDLLIGPTVHRGDSLTSRVRRRLPPDVIARGHSGFALSFDHRNQPAWLPLAPAHEAEPWRTMTNWSIAHQLDRTADRSGRSR